MSKKSPPADFPLCFPKENVWDFWNPSPPADYLCISLGEMFRFSAIPGPGLFGQVLLGRLLAFEDQYPPDLDYLGKRYLGKCVNSGGV